MTKKLMALIRKHPGISDEIRAELLEASRPERKSRVKYVDEWTTILHTLTLDRRTVAANLHSRTANLRPVYDTYIGILDKVKEQILIAQMHGTPAEAERKAAEDNKRRAAEGKRPGPTNSTRWQTWVPPHIKEALINQTNQAYAKNKTTQGNKFIPFMPPTLRKDIRQRHKNMRTTLDRLRRIHSNIPGANQAQTPYRALYLAAVRMAEIKLKKLTASYDLGAIDPIESPLPVNWLALLDHTMRARLRRAQANPLDVDLEGIVDFYLPAVANPKDLDPIMTEHDEAHANNPAEALDWETDIPDHG